MADVVCMLIVTLVRFNGNMNSAQAASRALKGGRNRNVSPTRLQARDPGVAEGPDVKESALRSVPERIAHPFGCWLLVHRERTAR